MKKSISTELTGANIARVLDLLAVAPAELKRLSAGLPGEQLQQPLGTGERSFAEDMAHLINSEARSSEAIYLALLVNEPLLADVHSERQFGKLLRFDLLPFVDLLAYFRLRRAILLRVLAGLVENQWVRTVREAGKQRQESVYWRARALALHEAEHLDDLAHKLGRSG